MQVRFHKLSDKEHGFSVVRADGSTLEARLDSRSYLIHDFSHFAVEQQAGLTDGFYGALAGGASFADLRNDVVALPPDHQRWRAERLAAPFQTLWSARDDAGFADRCAWYCGQCHVDDAFLVGALERMRRLTGHWKATPWGGVMEVVW